MDINVGYRSFSQRLWLPNIFYFCWTHYWERSVRTHGIFEKLLLDHVIVNYKKLFLRSYIQFSNLSRNVFVHYLVGLNLSQATKALRKSRGIALLYFRPRH